MATAPDWRTQFEQVYAGSPSAVYERVWREVFGDEYPEGVDPYSFTTRTELARFAQEVQVGPGQTLVDLGCGRGGAGLWVAASTGANLVGIDIAETALVAARARAAAMGSVATFRRGEFEATGLDDASVDAIMSVDALLFTPDKAAAVRELRRVLGDGGRLAFTSWDYHRQPKGRPPQVDDHRPLLAAAGFDVVAYDETEDWRRRCGETAAGLLRDVEELAAESGSDPDRARVELEEVLANIDTMIRRVFVVAEARVPSRA